MPPPQSSEFKISHGFGSQVKGPSKSTAGVIGDSVGGIVGLIVGGSVGLIVGDVVGVVVGFLVGGSVGGIVGLVVGALVTCSFELEDEDDDVVEVDDDLD